MSIFERGDLESVNFLASEGVWIRNFTPIMAQHTCHLRTWDMHTRLPRVLLWSYTIAWNYAQHLSFCSIRRSGCYRRGDHSILTLYLTMEANVIIPTRLTNHEDFDPSKETSKTETSYCLVSCT
jgi:hypothetical protein